MQKLSPPTLLLILTSTLTVTAQETQPPELKSAEVRKSLESFGNAIQLAKKSFEDGVSDLTDNNLQVTKLRDEHLAKLEEFLTQTTRSADLDESLKTRDIIQSLKVSKIEFPNLKLQAELANKRVTELEEELEALSRSKAKSVVDRRNRTTLAGTWRWFDGNDATFASNGQAIHASGILNAKWQLFDASKATFVIDWSNGSTEAVAISEGGVLLEGRSTPTGGRVWAVRLK